MRHQSLSSDEVLKQTLDYSHTFIYMAGITHLLWQPISKAAVCEVYTCKIYPNETKKSAALSLRGFSFSLHTHLGELCGSLCLAALCMRAVSFY